MTLHAPSYAGGFASPERGLIDRSLWDGVVGAWCPSLGATGLTLRDHSGHNQNAVVNSVLGDRWANPKGLTFDGINDIATFANEYIFSADFTVSFWGSVVAQTRDFWVSKGTTHYIDYDGPNNYISLKASTGARKTWTGITLTSGTVYHIAVSRIGNDLRLVINGVDQGGSLTLGVGETFNLTTMSTPGATFTLDGTLDDIRFYDWAPPTSEIALLHRLGPGGMYRRKRRVIAAPAAGRINSLIGVGGGMIGYGGGMIGRGY